MTTLLDAFTAASGARCPHCGENAHGGYCQWGRCRATDWSKIPAHDSIHRGFPVLLGAADHARVHDPKTPAAERARHLLGLVTDYQKDYNSGLGSHWSTDSGWAKHMAGEGWGHDLNRGDVDDEQPGEPVDTRMVVHARFPDRAHIEDDEGELQAGGVFGWNHRTPGYAAEHEVPLKYGAPVHVTGVSFKRADSDRWTHAPMDAPMTHEAAVVITATAEHRSALRAAEQSQADPDLAWHLTSSWHDVRAKAKKIVDDGGVHVFAVYNGIIGAQVKGDHAVYETHLSRLPGHYAVANFDCGCKWATFAFDRTGPFKKFQGRMCSHALALHYDTQSRHVLPDRATPEWCRPGTEIIMAHDAYTGRDMTRILAARTGAAYWPETPPVDAIEALDGSGPELAQTIRRAAFDVSELECPDCGSITHTPGHCPLAGQTGCTHCGDLWHDDEAHERLHGTGTGQDTFDEGFYDTDHYEAPPTPRAEFSQHLDRCNHCNSAFGVRQPLCPAGEHLWDKCRASETPSHTASAEMSLGETIAPGHTPGPHPTKPRSAHDNPASSGWATGPDPDQWSDAPLYPLDSRLGSTGDPEPMCATCGAMEPGHAAGRRDPDTFRFTCPTERAINANHAHFRTEMRPRGHDFNFGHQARDAEGTPCRDLTDGLHHIQARCSNCGTTARIGSGSWTLHGPMANEDTCMRIGEHGSEPNDVPIEHSIGAPCPHCKTPMSADASHYGCVLCGGKDHHSYCCPHPDGHTAAMRGKGACDTCGGPMFERERRAHCPHCGLLGSDFGGHHADCCGEKACEHCEEPLGGEACDTCGSDEHHSGCHPRGGGWDDGHPGGDGGGLIHAPRRNELGLAASRSGPEATFHEEPEAALPSTDGTGDGQMSADNADAEALTPQSFTASATAPVDTLAAFQARAAHLDPRRSGGGPGGPDGDIAAAARAHLAGLSKTALKDFSAAERQALINEGAGVRAGNSDRLDLTGTHYAELEQLLAADDDDRDSTWLA